MSRLRTAPWRPSGGARNRRGRVIALTLAAGLAAGAAKAQDRGSLEEFLGTIYGGYAAGCQGPDFLGDRDRMPLLFTAGTVEMLLENQAEGEAPVPDFDVFINAQDCDIADPPTLASLKIDGGRAEAAVAFTNFGVAHVTHLSLAWTSAGWRIHDMSWETVGTADPPMDLSLREILLGGHGR